jgi:hypothetical protein
VPAEGEPHVEEGQIARLDAPVDVGGARVSAGGGNWSHYRPFDDTVTRLANDMTKLLEAPDDDVGYVVVMAAFADIALNGTVKRRAQRVRLNLWLEAAPATAKYVGIDARTLESWRWRDGRTPRR